MAACIILLGRWVGYFCQLIIDPLDAGHVFRGGDRGFAGIVAPDDASQGYDPFVNAYIERARSPGRSR